jgi:hypothetical protein
MWRTIPAVLEAGALVGAGVWLAVAALSTRPVEAQGYAWAAVAISPSTLSSGESHAYGSQAQAESGALEGCQSTGVKDCKPGAVIEGGCVALAIPANRTPNHYGFSGGPTREEAATAALAACTKGGGTNCVVTVSPCSSDDVRWNPPLPLPPGGKPGSVDPTLVGLWKLNVDSGIWFWQISVNGTYTFSSEAPDKTPPHAGTFTASNGKYTLHAISMQWDDQGTYTIQGSAGSAGVVMTGKLGTGTWYRVAADPKPAEPASGPASKR